MKTAFESEFQGPMGKCFFFVLQMGNRWRKGICLGTDWCQIGARMKVFTFIITLNSDQCSFNILFAITKGIVPFITCMYLALQKRHACVPWLALFQTHYITNNQRSHSILEMHTVPGLRQAESRIRTTTSKELMGTDVATYLWRSGTELLPYIRSWQTMDPTLQTVVSSLSFQIVL